MAANMPSQGGDELMSDKHKAALTKHYETLGQNMTAGNMSNNFVSEGIITIPEQEELLNENVSSKRATMLLRLLIKRPDRTYYVLIEALKKYGQSHLAQLLEEEDQKP